MSSLTKEKADLSPLDQIRQTEADVARQIASAREEAGDTVTQAKTQAKDLLDEARQSGNRGGEKRYKEIISDAEEEARLIVAQAHKRAEHLQRKGGQRLAVGVRRALNIVIGLEEAGENE